MLTFKWKITNTHKTENGVGQSAVARFGESPWLGGGGLVVQEGQLLHHLQVAADEAQVVLPQLGELRQVVVLARLREVLIEGGLGRVGGRSGAPFPPEREGGGAVQFDWFPK